MMKTLRNVVDSVKDNPHYSGIRISENGDAYITWVDAVDQAEKVIKGRKHSIRVSRDNHLKLLIVNVVVKRDRKLIWPFSLFKKLVG